MHPDKPSLDYPIVLNQLERLEFNEWMNAFHDNWNLLAKEYFQFERLQNYQELSNPSYIAFASGDWNAAKQLINDAISQQAHDVRQIIQSGVSYTRVRALVRPVSDYLRWEYLMYVELNKLGQSIYFVDISNDDQTSRFRRSFDFLLFDRSTVMIQDYGKNGVLSGGWVVKSSSVSAFCDLADELLESSIPFTNFANEMTTNSQ